MMPPAGSVPPLDGAGGERGNSAAPWTGEKRRKTVGPPSTPPEAMRVDVGPQVQEEHGGQDPDQELVFTAQDDVDREELHRCVHELRRRQHLFYVEHQDRIRGDKARDEVYERLCELRYRDYNISIGRAFINADGKAEALLMIEYPNEVLDWESTAIEPGPSLFGWTYDPIYFDLADLDDYQRILPTRIDLGEFHDWEEYRLIFSKYETDHQYLKYCDEISKRFKWVEECMRLDYTESPREFWYIRGLNQAMIIAEGFSNLTFSLAERGYDEYVQSVYYNLRLKDHICFYFEVWKRVYKQEMSFEDALKLDIPGITFRGIELNLREFTSHAEFEACMEYIPKHVVEDEEVLKHIAEAVYKMKIAEIPKMYEDYVKKKLEVAERIQLFAFPAGARKA